MFAIVTVLIFAALFAVVGFMEFGRGRPFVGSVSMICALLALGYGVLLLRTYAAV